MGHHSQSKLLPPAFLGQQFLLAVVAGLGMATGCGGSPDTTELQFETPLQPHQCTIADDGPHWIVEGQELRLQARCQNGSEPLPEGEQFIWEQLPDGSSIDPLTATLVWTPRLDQAAMFDVSVGTSLSETRTTLHIGVLDNFSDPDNVLVVDPSQYPEEYGIPVLFLDPGPVQSASTKQYIPSTLTLAGQTYFAEAKNRGATSLNYPAGKRSYTLKFDKDDRFNGSLPGAEFINRRKLTVTTTFDDNSYLRQRLAYDLWNRLSPAHLKIEASHVVVFANGEYQGLFFLTDHVDRHLMGNHGLNKDGNLYKARNHQADFAGGRSGYTKEEGTPTDDFSDLVALVDFVDNSDPVQFERELSNWLVVDDFVDWNVFVRMICAGDSGGKNSYLYHEQSDAPWRFLPWDLNMSFGQNWRTYRGGTFDPQIPTPLPTDDDSFARVNRLMERMLAESEFSQAIDDAFERALKGPFSVESMHAAVDRIVAETQLSARRDWSRWQGEYRSYQGWRRHRNAQDNWTDYDGEVQFVKNWITARHRFLSTSFGLKQ